MALKFGAAVPVYNREWHIGPYLEQMDNLGIECVVVLGNSSWISAEPGELQEPDRTEKIIDTYFPHIKKIVAKTVNHRDSVTPALKELAHCDVNFVQDCDMYMTSEDWPKCFKWIEDNIEFGAFSVDFEKMFKEYYFNYNYGKNAIRGGDPPLLALKPPYLLRDMTSSTSPTEIVWSDNNVKIHHMRWCYKGNRIVWGEPIREPDSTKGYQPAPVEIVNLHKKWEQILKSI